jgi:hypothetical protein
MMGLDKGRYVLHAQKWMRGQFRQEALSFVNSCKDADYPESASSLNFPHRCAYYASTVFPVL